MSSDPEVDQLVTEPPTEKPSRLAQLRERMPEIPAVSSDHKRLAAAVAAALLLSYPAGKWLAPAVADRLHLRHDVLYVQCDGGVAQPAVHDGCTRVEVTR